MQCMHVHAKLSRTSFKTKTPRRKLKVEPLAKGKVSADTMEVVNTPSMKGYKHVLIYKLSEITNYWHTDYN